LGDGSRVNHLFGEWISIGMISKSTMTTRPPSYTSAYYYSKKTNFMGSFRYIPGQRGPSPFR
jgi:hypothetical protein